MKHEDDELNDDWNFVLVHQSAIPLRWIANALGSLASSFILKSIFADEEDKDVKSAFYSGIGYTLFPIYSKYGSFYEMKDKEEDL